MDLSGRELTEHYPNRCAPIMEPAQVEVPEWIGGIVLLQAAHTSLRCASRRTCSVVMKNVFNNNLRIV
jgi:hypothetical protein